MEVRERSAPQRYVYSGNTVAVPSKLNTLVTLAMIGAESMRDDGPPVTLRCTEIKRAGRRCKGKSKRGQNKCKDHAQ